MRTRRGSRHVRASRVPTHRIFVVNAGPPATRRWIDIGAAWQHADGKGFDLHLEQLPLRAVRIMARRTPLGDAA